MRYGISAVVLAALAMPAFAQPPADRAAMLERMMEADANHDGQVTRAELIAWRAANFTRFDRNGDGVLSDADMPRFARMTALGDQFDAMKAQFDVNHDGRVTRDEFVNGPTILFDFADANKDAVLTKAEVQAAAQRQRAGR